MTWVRQLRRRQSTQVDDDADELDEEPYDKNADMIASLRKAEARLAEARVALEQRIDNQGN